MISGMQKRADDGRQHGDDAGEHAAPRRAGMAHPQQREDEQNRRNQINQFFDVCIFITCLAPSS